MLLLVTYWGEDEVVNEEPGISFEITVAPFAHLSISRTIC